MDIFKIEDDEEEEENAANESKEAGNQLRLKNKKGSSKLIEEVK